jgi:hypothetical protein
VPERKPVDRPVDPTPLVKAEARDIAEAVRRMEKESFAVMASEGTLDRIHAKVPEKATPEEEAIVREILLADLRGQSEELAAEMDLILERHGKTAYNAGGKTARLRLGVKGSFNLKDVAVLQGIRARADLLGQFFADDLVDDLVATIARGFYDEGLNPLQVGRRIADKFDQFSIGRANATARTETLIAQEQAQFAVYQTSEVEFKDWATSFRNSRATHIEAHGQRRPMNEPFQVGAWDMMHPGDPSAGAEELVNCECTFLPVLEGVEVVAEDIWDGSQR